MKMTSRINIDDGAVTRAFFMPPARSETSSARSRVSLSPSNAQSLGERSALHKDISQKYSCASLLPVTPLFPPGGRSADSAVMYT